MYNIRKATNIYISYHCKSSTELVKAAGFDMDFTNISAQSFK